MKKNILIVLLTILSCLSLYYSYTLDKQLNLQSKLIESGYYNKGTYTDVNLDKNIRELKKENEELYKEIKEYKDEVNYLSQFKYHKEYVFDTIYTESYTKPINENVYTYSNVNNDSINYVLKIGSSVEPNWYSLNVKVSDKFTIINRNENDVNRTTITSDNSGVIEDVTIFNKKKTKFSNNFSHGLVVGGGYGVINHNFDIFVGYGLTIKF